MKIGFLFFNILVAFVLYVNVYGDSKVRNDDPNSASFTSSHLSNVDQNDSEESMLVSQNELITGDEFTKDRTSVSTKPGFRKSKSAVNKARHAQKWNQEKENKGGKSENSFKKKLEKRRKLREIKEKRTGFKKRTSKNHRLGKLKRQNGKRFKQRELAELLKEGMKLKVDQHTITGDLDTFPVTDTAAATSFVSLHSTEAGSNQDQQEHSNMPSLPVREKNMDVSSVTVTTEATTPTAEASTGMGKQRFDLKKNLRKQKKVVKNHRRRLRSLRKEGCYGDNCKSHEKKVDRQHGKLKKLLRKVRNAKKSIKSMSV